MDYVAAYKQVLVDITAAEVAREAAAVAHSAAVETLTVAQSKLDGLRRIADSMASFVEVKADIALTAKV